jgi:hypothetical protein
MRGIKKCDYAGNSLHIDYISEGNYLHIILFF